MSEDLDGKLPKQDLLLKILRMTTSDNDNIALNAIRRANEFLGKQGWDWEKLINSKIRIAADPFSNLAAPQPSRNEFRARPAPPSPPPRQRQQPAPPPPPRPSAPPPPPPRQPSPPPRMVNAHLTNMYAGWCYCCGNPVDSKAGWLFDPSDYNNSATSKLQVICHDCNTNVRASAIMSKAAVRRRQYVGGKAPGLGDI